MITDTDEAYEAGRRDAREQVADALFEHSYYADQAASRLRTLAAAEQAENGLVASVLADAAEQERRRAREWAVVAERVRNPAPPKAHGKRNWRQGG